MLGDNALHSVVSTVLFVKGKGRVDVTVPINGIPVEDVVTGATLVSNITLFLLHRLTWCRCSSSKL